MHSNQYRFFRKLICFIVLIGASYLIISCGPTGPEGNRERLEKRVRSLLKQQPQGLGDNLWILSGGPTFLFASDTPTFSLRILPKCFTCPHMFQTCEDEEALMDSVVSALRTELPEYYPLFNDKMYPVHRLAISYAHSEFNTEDVLTVLYDRSNLSVVHHDSLAFRLNSRDTRGAQLEASKLQQDCKEREDYAISYMSRMILMDCDNARITVTGYNCSTLNISTKCGLNGQEKQALYLTDGWEWKAYGFSYAIVDGHKFSIPKN